MVTEGPSLMFCCFPQPLTLLITALKDTGLLYPQQVTDAEKNPSFFQSLFYRKTSNPTRSRIPVQLHKKHYQGILLIILQISCVRAQKNCRRGSKIVTAVDKKKEKRQNLSCLFPLDFLSYFPSWDREISNSIKGIIKRGDREHCQFSVGFGFVLVFFVWF